MIRTNGKVHVRVTPRGGRDAILGIREGALVIRVSAPPVDGRANEAVCRLVAGVLRIARSRVAVVGGHRSRNKIVAVEGFGDTQLWEALVPTPTDHDPTSGG